MPTIQYSAPSARLSVLLSKLAWRDEVIRPRPFWQSEVPSTGNRRRRKFGEVSCTECANQGNDFELIPTVKNGNETHRNHLVINFCRSIIIVELYGGRKSQDVEKFKILRVLSKNDPLREHFQNSVLKAFTATRIDMLCSNFVEYGRRKSVKSCIRYALESESNIRLKPILQIITSK